ncbi:MAG: Mpo1-like protein [Rhodothalassiaceae bacterium]
MAQDRIQTYPAFFLFYLGEHAKPGTRYWHYLGAFASLTALAWGLLVGPWWVALLMPVAGYGPAWVSHAFIERNTPATFRYPLWSLISDYYMTWLWLTGGLSAKLAEAGVSRQDLAAAE